MSKSEPDEYTVRIQELESALETANRNWMQKFNEIEHLRAENEQLQAKLETEAAGCVDRVVHYRNLALELGAKPNQMLNKYDKDLAEKWGTNGYDASEQIVDSAQMWEENERLERELKQLRAEQETSEFFSFGPCVHSMLKADCPSCLQGHANRLEEQLRKLEASTALPIRERIERAVREQMTDCYQVYKGVGPTVEDWVGGALHYVMWGIERDLPLCENLQTATEIGERIRALQPPKESTK